jgi:hypothetical protein
MPKNFHKGTELNNVKETWDQNEKRDINTKGSPDLNQSLENTIEKEASEYENANKEERLLGGDRASVADDEGS